jgi:hypothetical protein
VCLHFPSLIVALSDRASCRAHIARWCAESNWPLKIVDDHQFNTLIKAGHPGTSLPSPMTVSCDVKAAFERCCECINTILKVHCLSIPCLTNCSLIL